MVQLVDDAAQRDLPRCERDALRSWQWNGAGSPKASLHHFLIDQYQLQIVQQRAHTQHPRDRRPRTWIPSPSTRAGTRRAMCLRCVMRSQADRHDLPGVPPSFQLETP